MVTLCRYRDSELEDNDLLNFASHVSVFAMLFNDFCHLPALSESYTFLSRTIA